MAPLSLEYMLSIGGAILGCADAAGIEVPSSRASPSVEMGVG
jgi:hypothetical protein